MVGKSDGILFALPEYNHSVSSPMKNAYDWLSRDDKNKYCPVSSKLGAMVSSGGNMGGKRSQEHLRQITAVRRMELLEPTPEAEIAVKRFSGPFFDEHGNLIDKGVRGRILPFLN